MVADALTVLSLPLCVPAGYATGAVLLARYAPWQRWGVVVLWW